jgi:hypothetical protein
MSNQENLDPTGRWKVLSIVLMSVIATVLILAIGMAAFRDGGEEEKVAAANPAAARRDPAPAKQVARAEAPAAPAPRRPSSADIQRCNEVADESRRTAGDTVRDAVIGGAAGAGVGAAGGAIAKGGRGAGKGAGIGAVVGAAAGTLYGLNEANKNDERVAAAYRDCMAGKGF